MNHLLTFFSGLTSGPRLLKMALPLGLCVFMILLTGCRTVNVTRSRQLSPEAALEAFYKNNGPEDTLMDPLILAGERVVPLVTKEVKNKEMPRRRYAIAFLGNGSYREALPVLQTIVQDSSEADYFRGDALISIYQIDETLGRELAQKYNGEENALGNVSNRVLTGDTELKGRRSYLDAVAGKHD